MNDLARLSLGTANFSTSYGFLGTATHVDERTIALLLGAAREAGIKNIDTAIGYGQAESILGALSVSDFLVTTKVPAVPDHERDVKSWMRNQVEWSLQRLKIEHLECVLLHQPQQLVASRGSEICDALCNLKDLKLTRKIGVSIYEPELMAFLDHAGALSQLSVVQAPLNVFDGRLIKSGWARKLKALGIEVEARSIFLQGLLTTPMSLLPPHFRSFAPYLQKWWQHLDSCDVSAAAAAISHVAQMGVASRIIVGVQNPTELIELSRATELCTVMPSPDLEAPGDLIDPRKWPGR